eukprot:jgi/Galph1/4180/GphlegSOOS_G2814.1
MSEEEPVDKKPEIEESCKPHCSREWAEYRACVKRIENDTTGEAHCTGQYLDFWHCVDHCAAKKIFQTLK